MPRKNTKNKDNQGLFLKDQDLSVKDNDLSSKDQDFKFVLKDKDNNSAFDCCSWLRTLYVPYLRDTDNESKLKGSHLYSVSHKK